MLHENQDVIPNDQGYSRMGEVYAHAIRHKNLPDMSKAELREYHAESVRSSPTFHGRPSRLRCIFAANTIEEAAWFGNSIEPKPETRIPIYEAFASNFCTLDMVWLDYDCDANLFLQYCRRYWYGEISGHTPIVGARKTPRLEVLVPLPARIGKLVGYA